MLRYPPAAGAYVHHWYTARLRRSSALPETERDAKWPHCSLQSEREAKLRKALFNR
jgi:hypothetical protein